MDHQSAQAQIARIIDRRAESILEQWRGVLASAGATGGGRIRDAELRSQCRDFLDALSRGLSGSAAEADDARFEALRSVLGDLSRSRASLGFSPSETAVFVFSVKEPLFEEIRKACADDAQAIADLDLQLSQIIDKFGIYTMEIYQNAREEVVQRQQDEITELSTPVVRLWNGILALPLIGTLDSARTQVVMETLLQAIVEESAEIAIIDITGVPTVDTLVAQHLLKTIAAARLMGAECIVSGVRPQIAQTMVHLGVELDVVSKSTLAAALEVAFERTGRAVIQRAARG